MKKTFLKVALLAIASAGIFAQTTHAASMIGFGMGTSGYGDLAMTPNDDQSSSLLNLPFALNYFGNTYNTFYANNNGNISFNGPLSTYTPAAFPNASLPIIAPYWGDVDTRGAGSVYVASPNPSTLAVTWDSVGYYSYGTDLLNSFQLLLHDRSNISAGDFDVEFRYQDLNWTTGTASGGSGGLGGTPAQAGYDAGDGINYLTLPGSQTAAVLDLVNQTNVAGGEAGQWLFAIRNGALPGSDAANPLMPSVDTTATDPEWNFDFNIQANQQIFIDPLVAYGYDYVVDAGPNFASVLLPFSGDNLYDLWLMNSNNIWQEVADLIGGTEYFFGGLGVDAFRITGVETSLGLDPNDPTAFVTGLTFAGTGQVSMRQLPLSIDTGNGGDPVPEPATMLLLGTGLAGLIGARRKK